MAVGSIPAWAGQPEQFLQYSDTGTVYPRVGGATGSEPRAPYPVGGLSPRGRGNQC